MSDDPQTDLRFFDDEPDTWFTVHPGQFVIFLSKDARLPMISRNDSGIQE
jgi:biofilm protein TabA